MTTLAAPVVPPDPDCVRETVDTLLNQFLDEQERSATEIPELSLFAGLLREFLAAGGKRIRPVLCVTGWHTVSAEPAPPLVWRLAASLELFHAFALIHDDIMDRSALRRGRPTAHRVLAALHRGHPDADNLGVNAAILLGDLALGWSYELLHSPPEPAPHQLAAIRPVLNALRTETLVGQYLDLAGTGRPTGDAATAWRIIRCKTAKYTIERPLQLGALLAGATPQQLQALSDYALPLGEAFQLRDDLLGAFGDRAHTGKSAIDDLLQGKHTVLLSTALQRATPTERDALQLLLARPHLGHGDAEAIRHILTTSGARREVEQMIAERLGQAAAALLPGTLRPSATAALRQLADAAAHRAL